MRTVTRPRRPSVSTSTATTTRTAASTSRQRLEGPRLRPGPFRVPGARRAIVDPGDRTPARRPRRAHRGGARGPARGVRRAASTIGASAPRGPHAEHPSLPEGADAGRRRGSPCPGPLGGAERTPFASSRPRFAACGVSAADVLVVVPRAAAREPMAGTACTGGDRRRPRIPARRAAGEWGTTRRGRMPQHPPPSWSSSGHSSWPSVPRYRPITFGSFSRSRPVPV